ncbi:MAG: UDP-N-acetylmuramoyl-tripeptide--D-alanyl-D-alanine ligase [Oscillospiraceae bacterium]
MEAIKLFDIVEAVGGSFGYPGTAEITSVSTDTRTITDGSVFVALRGEHFDGHDFAAKACELGAAAAITERAVEGARCIIVDSTHKALLDLAAFYRDRFHIHLVGITGSVGKTTTKELINLVVSEKFSTLATQGNKNNEIGLPMTLFGLTKAHGAAVIEMGMSAAGEISRLSMCARPTMAVITNIGYSHIENLGSQENILKAKMEILDGTEYSAPLILNLDDKLLAQIESKRDRRIIFYSLSEKGADCHAENLCAGGGGTDFIVCYRGGSIAARLNCPGVHNVSNALAAFCVGLELGIAPEQIVRAIASYQPAGMRQNMETVNGATFLIDCYNASPDSMKAALGVLKELELASGARRFAVLSDMLELGKFARPLHKTIGEVCAQSADVLVCCGEKAALYVEGALKKGMLPENALHFPDLEAMTDFLAGAVKPGDAVLFKASRGMALERAVERLRSV